MSTPSIPQDRPTIPEPPEPPCTSCVKELAATVALGLAGIREDLKLLFEQRQEDHLLLLKLRERQRNHEARITLAEQEVEGLKDVVEELKREIDELRAGKPA